MQLGRARAAKIGDRKQSLSDSYTHMYACAALCASVTTKNGGRSLEFLSSVRGKQSCSSFIFFEPSSTVGCRRTGGRRSQPGSFLFFTTSANLVLIFQSVFESHRLACSAQTVCDDACWAGMRLKRFKPSKWSRFEVSNAAEEVVFTANTLCVW